jgi:hypothetical protein
MPRRSFRNCVSSSLCFAGISNIPWGLADAVHKQENRITRQTDFISVKKRNEDFMLLKKTSNNISPAVTPEVKTGNTVFQKAVKI